MMLVAIKEDVQHNGAKGCEHNAAMQQRLGNGANLLI